MDKNLPDKLPTPTCHLQITGVDSAAANPAAAAANILCPQLMMLLRLAPTEAAAAAAAAAPGLVSRPKPAQEEQSAPV